MKPISLQDIVKAVEGDVCITENISIENISIDSRNIKENALFIPIKGENFDGHDYIEKAFSEGAIACLSDKDIKIENKIIIQVKDTKEALKDLAKYYLRLFDIPVIAITGSVGKTTTKDMIYSVLSTKYKVLKTSGNFNNEIGLPLTIFNLEDCHQIIILEMGMSNFGEINSLSEIAKPDIAVITNIGVSHIENLKTRENIFKAKCLEIVLLWGAKYVCMESWKSSMV